ncbi:MAG: GNAT family N-acetyltransferase [Lewinellaceae bacterium]|nr:GNAT family N-acetyltransferase [Saprospiraceae bacterium]MCB9315095.1 GNAT family N-acetyltransferase [Lewinellaceae bacterium]MCB9329881.1 GNAT family N-acetyltransferase [Lewinellaceae bacterium]
MQFEVKVADSSHHQFAQSICTLMEEAARVRGTGIAKRDPAYIQKKMSAGDAIIALDGNSVIGFCYIESWDGKRYVANSGLIVHPDYRKTGLARAIKQKTFELSKEKYPTAKLFGITTSLAVMKINSDLGYKPVTFSELTQDDAFWKGCQTCVNFDILQRTNRSMCLCTGMVCDLSQVNPKPDEAKRSKAWNQFKLFLKDRRSRIQRRLEKFPFLKQALKDEKV